MLEAIKDTIKCKEFWIFFITVLVLTIISSIGEII